MKYRSRTEIAALILESARAGATKAKIMYKSYLSYALFNEYLKFLQESDLIKYEKMAKRYRITEKGIKFLRSYDQILDLLSSRNNERTIMI